MMRREPSPLWASGIFMLLAWSSCGPAAAQPAFDCAKAKGEIPALICRTSALAQLDQKLTRTYAAAVKATDKYGVARLKTEQRGWIKGRDDCWKRDDKAACVRDAYTLRIAELQATYRLVKRIGPVFYACNGNPADEVVVTYFETEPRTAVGERGDRMALTYAQPAASGAKYAGGNVMLWEHHGELRVSWGAGAPEMTCEAK